MRVPTASLATLLVAALAGPLAGTSHAMVACSAVAGPATYSVGGVSDGYAWASGAFACASDYPAMTVQVCIDELPNGPGSTEYWELGCGDPVTKPGRHVTAEAHLWSVPIYSTWLRTRVTGSNGQGTTDTAETTTFWFNCACYIG